MAINLTTVERKTLRLTDMKVEPGILALPSSNSHQVREVKRSILYGKLSTSLNNQISDAQAFDNEFMENISHAHQLKCKAINKFAEYEKRLELEADRCLFLASELQQANENSTILDTKNNELIVEISSITELNESLSRQNDDLNKKLNSKELQLNKLNKKYQMLLEKSASLRKNYKDRLKSFINDMSLSDADSSDQESPLVIDDLEESVPVNNNKRRLKFDSGMSSFEDDIPTAKRLKNIDPNPIDANDVSTNDCVQQDERVEFVVENQPDSDDQITLMNDEPDEDDTATDDGIACLFNDGKLELFVRVDVSFF